MQKHLKVLAFRIVAGGKAAIDWLYIRWHFLVFRTDQFWERHAKFVRYGWGAVLSLFGYTFLAVKYDWPVRWTLPFFLAIAAVIFVVVILKYVGDAIDGLSWLSDNHHRFVLVARAAQGAWLESAPADEPNVWKSFLPPDYASYPLAERSAILKHARKEFNRYRELVFMVAMNRPLPIEYRETTSDASVTPVSVQQEGDFDDAPAA